jgi:hypothetical protein
MKKGSGSLERRIYYQGKGAMLRIPGLTIRDSQRRKKFPENEGTNTG